MSEESRVRKREEYLLGARSPLLLWRLQALKAGEVPPLLPDKIPHELLQRPPGHVEKEYRIEPLVEHARRVKAKERRIGPKLLWLLLALLLFLTAIGLFTFFAGGPQFRIGLIDVLIPRT